VDLQSTVDVLLGLVIAVGMWLMRVFHGRLNDHDKQFDELPNVYARRDDVKDMKLEIIGHLVRIENKLDRKVDKHGER